MSYLYFKVCKSISSLNTPLVASILSSLSTPIHQDHILNRKVSFARMFSHDNVHKLHMTLLYKCVAQNERIHASAKICQQHARHQHKNKESFCGCFAIYLYLL